MGVPTATIAHFYCPTPNAAQPRDSGAFESMPIIPATWQAEAGGLQV